MPLQISSLLTKQNRLTVGLILLWIGICTVSYLFKQSLGISVDLLPYLKNFKGIDILISVLLLSYWAFKQRTSTVWLWPFVFVGMLGLGGFVSQFIAFIPILLLPSALLVIRIKPVNVHSLRFGAQRQMIAVAVIAFLLGSMHASEIAASAHLMCYGLGFMTITLLIRSSLILIIKLLFILVTLGSAQIGGAQMSQAFDNLSPKTATPIHTQLTQTPAMLESVNNTHQSPKSIFTHENSGLETTAPRLLSRVLNKHKPYHWLDETNNTLKQRLHSVGITSPPARLYYLGALLLCLFVVPHIFCYVFYTGKLRDSKIVLPLSLIQVQRRVRHLLLAHFIAFPAVFANRFTFLIANTLKHSSLARNSIWVACFFLTRIKEFIMRNCQPKQLNPAWLPILLALFLPTTTYAHTASLSIADWQSGFLHPLQGLDHVCTMLAVGIWAAQLREKLWILPLTFVSTMVLGGFIGATGIVVNYAELIILLSGFVLSSFALKKVRFNQKVNVLIVAFFAFFHGYAHGAEISTSADFLPYSLGFITATSLLHLVGILLTKSTLFALRHLDKQHTDRCA
jgi:hydrogenase/urease accessory protein HupE